MSLFEFAKLQKLKDQRPLPILLAGWVAGWSVGWLARWLVAVSKGILKESYTNPNEVQPASQRPHQQLITIQKHYYVQRNTIQPNTRQHNAILYNTMQYNTIRRSVIQCWRQCHLMGSRKVSPQCQCHLMSQCQCHPSASVTSHKAKQNHAMQYNTT